MGLLDWIFGRKPAPIKNRDTGEEVSCDFRNGERPPDRKWRWHLNDVGGQQVALGVAGVNHHLAAVTKFIGAAQLAEQSDSRYGVLLEREPSNQVDPNAIRVMGWIGDPSHAIQLGYLFREDAAQIAKEFPNGTPLAALLWRVYIPNSEKLWVGIRLLIPAKRDPWWRENQ